MASALSFCMCLPLRVGKNQLSWVSAAENTGKKGFVSTCSEQKTKKWLVLAHVMLCSMVVSMINEPRTPPLAKAQA